MIALMLAYGLDLATYIYIAALLVSVALALSKKKPQLASLDDIFSSTATQGAYLPLVIGRQRVPTIVLWVEDAGVAGVEGFAEGTSGSQFAKGGGSTPPNPSYLERALHGLCVGPATELRAIYQNNEILWQGSLTPTSTPSGSSITVTEPDGTTSTFKIYWGFPEDPILPFLANSPTHGIPTRYSHSVKVLWDVKRLGQSRQWPRLEYEVVCPCYSGISSTPPEIPRTGTDLKPTWKQWNSIQTDGGYVPVEGLNSLNPTVGENEKINHYVWQVDSASRALIIVETRCKSLEPASGDFHIDYDVTPDGDWVGLYSPGSIIKVWVDDASKNLQDYHSPGLWTSLGSSMLQLGFSNDSPSSLGLVSGSWKLFRVAECSVIPNSGSSAPKVGTSPAVSGDVRIINTFKVVLGEPVEASTTSNLDLSPPTNNHIGDEYLFPSVTGVFALGIGIVEPVDTLNTDGINPIHILDQLLFSRYPYGAGRDRSKFDHHSIEVASQIMQAENIRGGLVVENGEGLESIIGKILQDIGLAIPYNPLTGLYTFRLMRYEQTFTSIPREMLLEEITMENIPGDRPADVLAFTFIDRERNYREVPVRIQDNGQIVESEIVKATKVPISITNDRDSVSRMAPRRGQEALGAISSFTLQLSHKAALATPSSRFRMPSFEDPNVQFIVGSVKRSLDSNKVEVVAVLDAYDPPGQTAGAVTASLGFDAPPTPPPAKKLVDPLNDFIAIEVPRALSQDGRQVEVLFGASRLTEATLGASVWISADGLSYVELAPASLVAQGALLSALSASGPTYDDAGLHEFEGASDVDLAAVEDLTLYPDSWRAGRQVMLIGSEVIFLRNAYLTSSTEDGVEGFLEGLIRARAGTIQQDHPEGTPFYLIYAHRVVRQTSPAFIPGRTISYKVSAREIRRNQPLAEVSAKTIELQGLAMRPLKPSALRLAGFQRAYSSVDDLVEVTWAYHSTEFPRTGLGNQTCGAASGTSKPAGHFLMTISPPGGAPDHVEVVETASFVLDSAFRASLGLDTGAPWTLKVAHVEGSFTSEQAILTLNSY